jgi:hypothetical protein
VDDCLCIGDKQAIKSTVQGLKNSGLNITVTENLKDYLSPEILLSFDRKTVLIHQPRLIKSMEEYEKEIQGLQVCKTPGMPGQGMRRTPGWAGSHGGRK